MKPCFLITLILLTTGSAVSAQQQDPVMTRSRFTPVVTVPSVKFSIKPGADTSILRRLLKNRPANQEWYQEGIMVDSTQLGKVYRMPIDNMLCLVPDARKTAGMPVKRTRMPEPMPNAYLQNRKF